jgi:hypothetical protein
MNIEARTELMAVLTEISRMAPYYRLGQLIGLLTDMTDHPYTVSPVMDIEDEELLPAAKDFLEDLRQRTPESLEQQIRAHLESDALAAERKPSTAS